MTDIPSNVPDQTPERLRIEQGDENLKPVIHENRNKFSYALSEPPSQTLGTSDVKSLNYQKNIDDINKWFTLALISGESTAAIDELIRLRTIGFDINTLNWGLFVVHFAHQFESTLTLPIEDIKRLERDLHIDFKAFNSILQKAVFKKWSEVLFKRYEYDEYDRTELDEVLEKDFGLSLDMSDPRFDITPFVSILITDLLEGETIIHDVKLWKEHFHIDLKSRLNKEELEGLGSKALHKMALKNRWKDISELVQFFSSEFDINLKNTFIDFARGSLLDMSRQNREKDIYNMIELFSVEFNMNIVEMILNNAPSMEEFVMIMAYIPNFSKKAWAEFSRRGPTVRSYDMLLAKVTDENIRKEALINFLILLGLNDGIEKKKFSF